MLRSWPRKLREASREGVKKLRVFGPLGPWVLWNAEKFGLFREGRDDVGAMHLGSGAKGILGFSQDPLAGMLRKSLIQSSEGCSGDQELLGVRVDLSEILGTMFPSRGGDGGLKELFEDTARIISAMKTEKFAGFYKGHKRDKTDERLSDGIMLCVNPLLSALCAVRVGGGYDAKVGWCASARALHKAPLHGVNWAGLVELSKRCGVG